MIIPAFADLGLRELRNPSPLIVQLLPTGAIFALRHGPTLLNQLLAGPAEDGLFRLLLRWRTADGQTGWAPLVGPTTGFAQTGPGSAAWGTAPAPGLTCSVVLQLHPRHSAWAWRIHVRNESGIACRLDALHAQDLGLADEGAVRNNEAYTSQYIDFLPIDDDELGWAIFARQNQPMAAGRHPWLALACATGAAAFCTDGWQFFGADHRLTGEPAAVRLASLPSRRLQYEFALAGLQSRALELPPGGAGEIRFVARFLEDHPEASAPADLAWLKGILHGEWPRGAPGDRSEGGQPSVFVAAKWLHGDQPTETDMSIWFPGAHRQIERAVDGTVLAFFCGADTHVVTRAKEAVIARPHGHLLRSGEALWNDDAQFGLTVYAAGVFAAQAYFGNPSLARLLPPMRNALNVVRGNGQRAFVRHEGAWRQLGIPSTFAMSPGEVRWIYRIDTEVIEARVWCGQRSSHSFLELRVIAGAPREFLVTHHLVTGAHEFESAGAVEFFAPNGCVECEPAGRGLLAERLPGTCFAVAALDPATVAAVGGDELLYPDRVRRNGPYAVILSRTVNRFGVALIGSPGGRKSLPAAVAAARGEYAAGAPAAVPPAAPLRLRGTGDAGVARVNEVLPWFAHNASIHFSAPHGLEQYGGGAWGVRDVCQGSVEWLLAAGRSDVVRRLLLTVFAQQYPHDGSWPQWFMFPPFRTIQQAHSHGDVCFWPVKALCDYVEASNDVAFLQTRVGYTDPRSFEPTGPEETLGAHCDRVIAHVESRSAAGSSLVDYGDGDWDDTLQPADPKMRTSMISAWTVGLEFQTFRQLAAVSRHAGQLERAARLESWLGRLRNDFAAHLMPGGIVAGFVILEPDGRARPLLHPTDGVTGIRYRLLPMTRSILAELFAPAEAARHLEIIARELWYPDGVRLMSEPATYRGGTEQLFQRAESAANVGREIGLQYVHAHLRYAEALAKVGDAAGLWAALQVVNPVGLAEVVRQAEPRQSNVYFSSSDADFPDRYEAAARWRELRTGQVGVRGGWRLYSSGPGLFLHTIRACLLGVRESFGDLVFDPVMPRSLDGLIASMTLCGRRTEIRYQVKTATFAPSGLTVNGVRMEPARRDPNPYRAGGLRVPAAEVMARFEAEPNRIVIEL